MHENLFCFQISARHTGARVALTQMFSKQAPNEFRPVPENSEIFLNTFLKFKHCFDHLTSHYLLLRGLFEFHRLEKLDDAWRQLTADTPSWPVDFFYNQ
jgi:hypothetical protein